MHVLMSKIEYSPQQSPERLAQSMEELSGFRVDVQALIRAQDAELRDELDKYLMAPR